MIRSKDQTATSRTAQQRKRRLAAGWVEVKVWVANSRDAEKIRDIAAQSRADAPPVAIKTILLK